MALAVLTTAALQAKTPHQGRPLWLVAPIVEVVLLGLIVAEGLGWATRHKRASRRLRLALISIMTAGVAGGFASLTNQIVGPEDALTATVLLMRGAALWVTIVIVFSLWFWEMDRGGPVERDSGSRIPASFAFPEEVLTEPVSRGWQPRYQDYLYLAFTNATAFGVNDTPPVKIWAKMTMMLEAALSVGTALLVIARAINVLPP